jgi:hypothetical protein
VVRWLKAHPTAADALLALLVMALSLPGPWVELEGVDLREPDGWAVALIVVRSAALAWRRWRPLAVLAVAGLATVVSAALGYGDTFGGISVLVALYTVAAHCPRRQSVEAAVITAVALLVALLTGPWPLDPTSFVANYVIFGTAWILGDNVRVRRAYVAELEDRAARLEREREDEVQQAAAEERARIARELHDVVAHNMSVMVVQAGGARRVLDREPERAREALASIEDTGRQALGEMRRLLGVLRPGPDDEAAERAPEPGLADVASSSTRCGRRGWTWPWRCRANPGPWKPPSTCRPTASCRRPSPTPSSTPDGPRPGWASAGCPTPWRWWWPTTAAAAPPTAPTVPARATGWWACGSGWRCSAATCGPGRGGAAASR